MKQSTNTRMLRTIITDRIPTTTGAHRLRLDQHELGHSVTTTVDHNRFMNKQNEKYIENLIAQKMVFE